MLPLPLPTLPRPPSPPATGRGRGGVVRSIAKPLLAPISPLKLMPNTVLRAAALLASGLGAFLPWGSVSERTRLRESAEVDRSEIGTVLPAERRKSSQLTSSSIRRCWEADAVRWECWRGSPIARSGRVLGASLWSAQLDQTPSNLTAVVSSLSSNIFGRWRKRLIREAESATKFPCANRFVHRGDKAVGT